LGWHVVGSQSRYDPVAAAFAPLAKSGTWARVCPVLAVLLTILAVVLAGCILGVTSKDDHDSDIRDRKPL
jgi:hypothetical protein